MIDFIKNIKYNIQFWFEDKRYLYHEKQLKKKYPNWNFENWVGDFEFIWGIKSWDCLVDCEANIHTMNDIEIDYDHETKKYLLSIETAYMFENKHDECEYLKNLLKCFEKYMDDNGLNKNEPYMLFMNNPCTSMKAETIEELYTNFKIFVDGFCNQDIDMDVEFKE